MKACHFERMPVKLATTPATFLATKVNFNQSYIYDQHHQENHENDIGSALNPKVQGQIQGQRTEIRKWPIRYCPILKILVPKVQPVKSSSRTMKPISIKVKIQG